MARDGPAAHSLGTHTGRAGMDARDGKRKKRAPMSCDRCKARKTKCIDPVPGPCRFCASIGATCHTDPSRRRQRPYYHVSEQEFRYMTKVLRHYLPDTELNLQSLKAVSESLDLEASVNEVASVTSPLQSRDTEYRSVEPTSILEEPETKSSAGSEESLTIDEIGTLYGQLAWLIVDSRGNYRHVGADSGFSFNAAARAFKRGKLGAEGERDVIGPLRAGNLPPETPESSIGVNPIQNVYLPPREIAFLHAERFFSEVHSLYWFFSTEQFYSRLERTYSDEAASATSSWLCSLYSIFAFTSESQVGSSDSFATQDRSSAEYFAMAKALVPAACDEADIDSIRALCLLGIALTSACFSNTAYLYIGTAARIAFSLGLHLNKSPSSRSSLDKEYERRVWCSLYILDHDTALRYGNPCAITEETSPKELQVPSEQILSPGANMPINYLALSCELSRFKRQISNMLYTRAKTDYKDIPITAVSSYLQTLKGWYSALPNHLRDLHHVAAVHKRSVGMLHLRYWSTVVFATRPFLLYSAFYTSEMACSQKKKWFDELSGDCTNAAEKSLDILKQLASCQALSSLTTFDCTCILENLQVFFLAFGKIGQLEYKSHVRDCIDVLRCMECVGWTKHALSEALNQLEDSGFLNDDFDIQFGRDAFNQSIMNGGQGNEIFPNLMNSADPDWWDCFGLGGPELPLQSNPFGDNVGVSRAPILS